MDELKEEVKIMKRVMGQMVKSLKSIEGEQEVKSKKNNQDEIESVMKVKDTESGKEELKCNYKTKKKVTLMKHLNTKHCSVERKENSDEISNESKGKRKEGKKCDNCENCDQSHQKRGTADKQQSKLPFKANWQMLFPDFLNLVERTITKSYFTIFSR